MATPPRGRYLTAKAFVSLHARGQLRGRIGTTGPTTANVAWGIVHNAVSVGTRAPSSRQEPDSLEYSVDVLDVPEPISSPAQLDVKRYGVIVSCGSRRGLLLPNLGGVDTVERSIALAVEQCRVEVTTLLVPGENDSAEEICALAQWPASVNPDLPLHLSRFFPQYQMQNRPPTSVKRVYRLAEEARNWLAYVYTFCSSICQFRYAARIQTFRQRLPFRMISVSPAFGYLQRHTSTRENL